VPTATCISPPFKTMSLRRRESLGMEVPLIWVVHPMMTLGPAEVEALADRILPDVVQAYVHGVRA